MIEVLIDAVADTLEEVNAEALHNAVGGTVAEFEALSDIKAETLVEVLHHTSAKIKVKTVGDTTGKVKNQGGARHAGLHACLG